MAITLPPHAASARRPFWRHGVLTADLCVIGAGGGGLSAAAGAARMGASVLLVEAHRMGGDCLNTGCVPSKALVSAAHAAHSVRASGRFGVNGHERAIDFGRVHEHVHGAIAAIAPRDSVARFEALGVTVIKAVAYFTEPNEIVAGDQPIRSRRFIIATGSSPAIPTIPGLDDCPYLTNESVFGIAERPDHLVVLGGGPIGVEMAQAFRRLGSGVTLVQRSTILPKDEPEAANILRAVLTREGVRLNEHATVTAVERAGNGIVLTVADRGTTSRIPGSHLYWSRPAGARIPRNWGWTPPVSRGPPGASPLTQGFGPTIGASLRSAMSPGVRNSPTSPATRPAS